MSDRLKKEGQRFGLKLKRIDMGIFEYPIFFATGKHAKMQAYIRWKFDDPEFNDHEHACGSKAMTYYRSDCVVVIWMPRKPQTIDELASASHEALHAVFNLFDWVGMKMHGEAEEVACHAVAHLVREMAT